MTTDQDLILILLIYLISIFPLYGIFHIVGYHLLSRGFSGLKIINKWKNLYSPLDRTQGDKFELHLRYSYYTLFKFSFDISRLELELIIFDLGISLK